MTCPGSRGRCKQIVKRLTPTYTMLQSKWQATSTFQTFPHKLLRHATCLAGPAVRPGCECSAMQRAMWHMHRSTLSFDQLSSECFKRRVMCLQSLSAKSAVFKICRFIRSQSSDSATSLGKRASNAIFSFDGGPACHSNAINRSTTP